MKAKAATCFGTVVLLLVAGCTGTSPRLEVERSGASREVSAAVEVDARDLGLSQAVVRLGDGVVLQAAPALFGAPDTVHHPAQTAYCAILPADLQRGPHQTQPIEAGDAFSLNDADGRLIVSQSDSPVFSYNYGTQLSEGLPEENARSSYIHPLWGLDGTILTDDFPADHLHHRGLSWMWPRVFVDGEEYDVWALKGMKQVFDTWLVRETGPVCATIGVKNQWELTADGRSVVDEWVWIRTYTATPYGRAIDIRLTLEAREPVEIAGRETGNKGYGGFSLRFAPRENTTITSEDGHEAEDSDQKRLRWADQSGRFGEDGAPHGIAIFQHEAHPDFPARWTLRHYGFLGVAWPGVERRTLRPDEPVTLRYRVWIHGEDAGGGRVAEAYDAFAHPPLFHVAE